MGYGFEGRGFKMNEVYTPFGKEFQESQRKQREAAEASAGRIDWSKLDFSGVILGLGKIVNKRPESYANGKASSYLRAGQNVQLETTGQNDDGDRGSAVNTPSTGSSVPVQVIRESDTLYLCRCGESVFGCACL